MEKILVIRDGQHLAFLLDNNKKIRSFDVEDFIHDGMPLLRYSDSFIYIDIVRGGKITDALHTTAEKNKYPGDVGELMFCGQMPNSQIIINWKKKNPNFTEITRFSTGISAGMFQEGDILKIESSFNRPLSEISQRAKLFI